MRYRCRAVVAKSTRASRHRPTCERLGALVCSRVRRFHVGGLVGWLTLVACSGGDRTYNTLSRDASVDASAAASQDASSTADSSERPTAGAGTLTLTLDRSIDDAGNLATDAEVGSQHGSNSDGGRTMTSDGVVRDGGAPNPTVGDGGANERDAEAPSDASATNTQTTAPVDASTTLDGSSLTSATSDSLSSSPTSGETEDAGEGCTPTGVEQCFNQRDDDCNNSTDCEDPACNTSATCEPAGTTQGLLIEESADCPPGYEEEPLELHQGLDAPECSGCTCSATVSQCTGELYFYTQEGDCAVDAASLTGGVLVDPVTAECPGTPHMDGFTEGYRVGTIGLVAGTGTCAAGGTATLGEPSWLVSMKYCVAARVGSGCEPGYACVPKVNSGAVCTESEGACIGDQVASTWYEGYLDERTCGECSCDGAGGCGDVQVELGSDWVCDVDNPATSAGEQNCDVTPYSPPAMLVGTPTPPACEPVSEVDGDLTPLGRHRLCCAE
jgi:hypothetical protein